MARTFLMDDDLPVELLCAIGEVAVAEAQLEGIMVNALKRAYGLSVSEANNKSENDWSSFYKQRKALASKFKEDFPDDTDGQRRLSELLSTAKSFREQRNTQVHSMCMVDLETGQPLRVHRDVHIGHDTKDAIAIRDGLRGVRNEIEIFTREYYLNRQVPAPIPNIMPHQNRATPFHALIAIPAP